MGELTQTYMPYLQRLLHNLSNKDLELQKSNNGKRALEKQLEDMLKQKEHELNVC